MVISALTRAELLALLGAARAGRERDWLLFVTSYNHALRASEACQLTGDSISSHGIRVVGLKDGETVTQPLMESTEPLLNEASSLFAFARFRLGKQSLFQIGRRRFWELMQRYGKTADIAPHKRHPHVLRHTCATDLTEKKVPLEKIQAWMRHKNLGSTGIYLRPTQEQVNSAVRAALG